jgi:hypothetical protein
MMERAIQKEPKKARLLEPVNGCNDKASYGYGEGQNTECSEQLEGMHFDL